MLRVVTIDGKGRVDVIKTLEEVVVVLVKLWFTSQPVDIVEHRERRERWFCINSLQRLAYFLVSGFRKVPRDIKGQPRGYDKQSMVTGARKC
jgi:hypothetical protein